MIRKIVSNIYQYSDDNSPTYSVKDSSSQASDTAWPTPEDETTESHARSIDGMFNHSVSDVVDCTEDNSSDNPMYMGTGGDDYVRVFSRIDGDSYDGGEGRDTIDWRNSGQIDTAVYNLTVGTATSYGRTEVMANFEVFHGTSTIDVVIAEDSDLRDLTIFGWESVDRLTGGGGNDLIYGGNSSDELKGQSGNDALYGGDSLDELYGGSGDDTLWGENFPDDLYGGQGTDVLYGGDGIDDLEGGEGQDSLYGGAGDDRVVFDELDFADGGEGADTILAYLIPSAGAHFELEAGTYTSGNVIRTWRNFEHYSSFGGPSDERVSGTSDANEIKTGDGDNLIAGLGGDDSLEGEGGSDTLEGGTGQDRLYGGDGADRLLGGDGDDTAGGDDGDDELWGARATTNSMPERAWTRSAAAMEMTISRGGCMICTQGGRGTIPSRSTQTTT